MATCIQSITTALAAGIDLLPELFPSTITPFTITQTQNALIRVRIPTFQTVGFSVVLSPTTVVTSVNVSFTVYRIEGTTATDVGGVSLTELNSFFTKDFQIGEYIICIRTNNMAAYNGNLTGTFTGYPTTLHLQINFADGASVNAKFDDYHPPRPCDEAMFYEILEGALPPGITMNDLGKLNGVLPNLDCIDPEDQYSPSQNWFYEQDGTYFPWGRQWRFKVRVSLADYPDSFDEDWFCIRIHNNWDFDRDNFLSQMPFEHINEVEVVEPPKKLPQTLCMEPCGPEPPKFTPQPIQEICEPCVNPDVITDVTLIAIPEQLAKIPPSQFAIWYDRNKDLDLSLECFEVRKFLTDLKNSKLFTRLLEQNGLAKPSKSPEDMKKELLVATQFQNFLQITASQLIKGKNPSDLDYQMEQWRNAENQKLPITAISLHGESLQVTFA